MLYLPYTPRLLQWWFGRYTWHIPSPEKTIYLTFDDGVTESLTPFILRELQRVGAKATFFCVGANIPKRPDRYAALLADGHAVGNHSQHHLNGWKTPTADYLRDIEEAAQYIDSDLFRPPYGRMTRAQAQQILPRYHAIMWDVMSADFDPKCPAERGLEYVLRYTQSGSVVLMHDNEKFADKVRYILPRFLDHFAERGYRFERIESGLLPKKLNR